MDHLHRNGLSGNFDANFFARLTCPIPRPLGHSLNPFNPFDFHAASRQHPFVAAAAAAYSIDALIQANHHHSNQQQPHPSHHHLPLPSPARSSNSPPISKDHHHPNQSNRNHHNHHPDLHQTLETLTKPDKVKQQRSAQIIIRRISGTKQQ